MTNTEALDKKIKESGLKKIFIVKALGLSLPCFRRKMHNIPGSEFRPSEIAKLKNLLNLTDSDVLTIFFCPES
ncbi:MAG TPA: toxin-antitoxin system, antitoxin component, Xre family protein [Lachnospiraceae bacterium]|nr:toxin-antitoxin system, antitoxin component, Xre family protein [Lachnospiraceae bacterium]